jgi:hypothetical protein
MSVVAGNEPCVSSGRHPCTQHQHKLAVTSDMVVALLRYNPHDLMEFRNILLACALTIGCMRPCEATACSLVFDSDYHKDLRQYTDSSTLTTIKRNQD